MHTGSTAEKRRRARRPGGGAERWGAGPGVVPAERRRDAIGGGRRAGVTERRRTAQVGFSSDGSMLVITARGTDSILTYQVAANGTFGEGFQCAGNRTLCGHSLDVDGSGDRARRTAAPSTTYRPGWWLFSVFLLLPAAATPYLASLADISMRRGEFLNSLVAMTANLAFIPLGTVGPRHPQVRVYACEVPS